MLEGHIRYRHFHNDSLCFISAIFLHLLCLEPLCLGTGIKVARFATEESRRAGFMAMIIQA